MFDVETVSLASLLLHKSSGALSNNLAARQYRNEKKEEYFDVDERSSQRQLFPNGMCYR